MGKKSSSTKHGTRRAGKLETDTLMGGVAELLYANPRRYGFSGKDDIHDAFAAYWERIKKLALQFHERGPAFEPYFYSSIRYMAKSLKRDRAKRYYMETACVAEQRHHADQGYQAADEFVDVGALAAVPLARGVAKSGWQRAFQSRVAFLCARCAPLVDDGLVARVARHVGLNPLELIRKVRSARAIYGEEKRTQGIRRRGRDTAWLRMMTRLLRIRSEYDPDVRAALKEGIERDRRLYRRAVDAMSRYRALVPNEVVAKVMGVPKGTVDAGLHYMKQGKGGFTPPWLAGYAQARRPHDHQPSDSERAQGRRTTAPAVWTQAADSQGTGL